jgi:hypothetical protein
MRNDDRPLTVDEGDAVSWHTRHAIKCLELADTEGSLQKKVEWLTSAVWDLLLVVAATDPAVSHTIAQRAQPFLEKLFPRKGEDDE